MLSQVINKPDTHIMMTDTVSAEQFAAAWRLLGVPVNSPQAAAVFDRHGQDAQGRLPIMVGGVWDRGPLRPSHAGGGCQQRCRQCGESGLFQCELDSHVQVFVEALLMGAPRLRMAEGGGDVQRGAYNASRPAQYGFGGKILYPQCKKGVWAPTGWDGSAAERSARLPEAQLELEFVHGYDGWVQKGN